MNKPVVLYQDEWLVVVDKPAGMVVNRAESVRGPTVQDWVEDEGRLVLDGGEDESGLIRRSGLAHRLDKDTSGVLVVARDAETLKRMLGLFKDRKVDKRYVALLHGRLTPKTGFVKLPIGRSRYERERFEVVITGKTAVTNYEVREYFEAGSGIGGREAYAEGFSWVELGPVTGRTHQIRVHMRHLRHPLAGDRLYLGKKRWEKDRTWCPRHCLHAQKIGFVHPRKGDRLEVEAPLPKDLLAVKNSLTRC